MKWIIRVSDQAYREHIQDEANEGRLPMAWLTFGHVTGRGWGFLHPWEQQAIFPGKGKYGADTDLDQRHEPFLILRIFRAWKTVLHPNHLHPTVGRFARGLVWRRKWGIRPRMALLDPDVWVSADGGRVRAQ